MDVQSRPGFIQCRACRATKGFIEDTKTGDMICTNCGLVLEEKIMDMGADWRNFSDSDKDRSHAGLVNSVFDSLATQISSGDGSKGKNSRLNAAQKSIAMESSERGILEVVSKINEMGNRLNFTEDVLKRARHAYKTFHECKQRTVRGSRGDAIVCALLYLACKEEGVPRTFRELAKESGVNEKEMRKMYTTLTKELPKTAKSIAAVAPADLISRFCSKLQLSQAIASEAQEIAKKGTPQLEGKNPNSIAAASILMATKSTDNARMAKEIAKAASITASTVLKIHAELQQYLASADAN